MKVMALGCLFKATPPRQDLFGRMWSNIWDFSKLPGNSHEFSGINPKYLTTATLGRVSFEISP